jgi:DNA repair protein RadC
MNTSETLTQTDFQLEKFLIGEIITTYNRKRKKTGIFIRNSRDIYNVVIRLYKQEDIEHRERMFAVFLNRRHEILGWQLQSLGGLSGTVCDPKMLFQSALLANAASIILVHNHPSGNLSPSQEDISLTRKVKEGGKLLEIQLLDHLILNESTYCSLADEGYL